jgi:hypothetical protein
MRMTEREPRDVVELARRARAKCDALQRDRYREAVSIAAARWDDRAAACRSGHTPIVG